MTALATKHFLFKLKKIMASYLIEINQGRNWVQAEMQDYSMQHPHSGASFMLLKTRKGLGILAHHCNLATANWQGQVLSEGEYEKAESAFAKGGDYDNTKELLSECGLTRNL